MKLTDFIFLAQTKIVVKPEAGRPLELTAKEIDEIIKRGEKEAIGSTYRLRQDIYSIIGPYTKELNEWFGALKAVNSILSGWIMLKDKDGKDVSVTKLIFHHTMALPFRWALQAKHKMFWALKKRALHSVVLSLSSMIKRAMIFIIMLFSKVALLFSGIITVIKAAINKVIGFLSTYFGISISFLTGAAISAGLMVAAILGIQALITNTASDYQNIIENTRKENFVRIQDQLKDETESITTYYKLLDMHTTAIKATFQNFHVDMSTSVTNMRQLYNMNNLLGPPGAVNKTIEESGINIAQAMYTLLGYVFSPGAVSRLSDSFKVTPMHYVAIPPSDGLHPFGNMNYMVTMANRLYEDIKKVYAGTTTTIINFQNALEYVLYNAENMDISEVRKYLTAINYLKSAPRLYGDIVVMGPAFIGPGRTTYMGSLNLETLANEVEKIQQMYQKEMESVVTTKPPVFGPEGRIDSRQSGGSNIESREQLDKKTRRFRNLNVEINGDIELVNNDRFGLSDFSEKLSKYLEQDIKKEWS